MLQDAHSRKINEPVSAGPGANIIIPSTLDRWIYVHELVGDLSGAGTVDVISGVTTLASFTLDAGQGLTLTDEPGEDNRPRFECPPGQDFILTVAGGTFEGNIHWSERY